MAANQGRRAVSLNPVVSASTALMLGRGLVTLDASSGKGLREFTFLFYHSSPLSESRLASALGFRLGARKSSDTIIMHQNLCSGQVNSAARCFDAARAPR
jgi:hypothetical protein